MKKLPKFNISHGFDGGWSPTRENKGLSRNVWRDYIEKDRITIVDLGCGYKKFVSINESDKIIGLDFNSKTKADYVCNLSKDKYPFENNSIDAIVSYHCLEHLSDRTHAFREVHRILKKGGLFQFCVPHSSSPQAFNFDHLNYWNLCSISFWANTKWYYSEFPTFNILKAGVSYDDTVVGKLLNPLLNLSFNLTENYLKYLVGGIHECQFLLRKPF